MDFDLISDQEMVARQAREFQRLWLADRLDEAHIEWDVVDSIVERWKAAGRMSEFLTPLLDHELTAVRYMAAVYLANQTHSERSWEVMREIYGRTVPEDFVFRELARLSLMENGRL